MMNKKETVAFYTLGCKVNQHDSESMAALFENAGYEVVDFEDKADVYVINTCTVTHLSDRKSRQMIRRAKHQSPEAVICVSGCYAEVSADEVAALPEVDILIGTNERHQIVKAVESYRENGKTAWFATPDELAVFEPVPENRQSKMTRAYMKVQEGCEQFCNYCIIPYARGPLRSRPLKDCVEEVLHLEKMGYQEVILTGIHLGAYGEGKNDEGYHLVDLCQALLNETTIQRIRLSSLEPMEATTPLLQLMQKNERMAKHLHLPLQAGSDAVLKAMNRPYRSADFRQKLVEIRQMMPQIAITTDYMVGFPGETDEDFQESLAFVKEMAFADMHLFKYSPRAGTPAALEKQIAPEIKEARRLEMANLRKELKEAYEKEQIGRTLKVLIETTSDGLATGHSSNYQKVVFPTTISPNHFVDVTITEAKGEHLYGHPSKEVK